MYAVEICDVSKTFGRHTAVDGLSLSVPEGTIYGFIGPNGSGKTTTLRMVMRILHPDRGMISVLGQTTRDAVSDQIGYLPEERGLYKKMKVAEVLRFYGELKRCRDVRTEVARWLDKMGLADWSEKRVETLSKGMAQKVQFIAAVVAQPALVILDEPFSGLDPVNADVLRDAVLDLRRGGTTVIFSTHDMAVAEKMCDAIFMIYRGRKVLDGTLEEIQSRYGEDTLRVRVDSDGEALRDLPGVERVNDFGRFQELRMSSGTDSQQILLALAARTRVHHFELARPSLHDIFVRIAGPEAMDPGHAAFAFGERAALRPGGMTAGGESGVEVHRA